MSTRLNSNVCLALLVGLIAVTISPRLMAQPDAAPPQRENTLLEVLVTYQEPDVFVPWRKREIGNRQGYAVAVDTNRLITLESLVRNQTLVELRRAKTGEKFSARVLMADPQVDLALLETGDNDLIPLLTEDLLHQDDVVSIVQLNDMREIRETTGHVVQITTAELPQAPYHTLIYQVFTDMTVHGQGAAVLLGGKLAGLMMSYSSGERIGYVLPSSVMERFLDDVRHPPYRGIPSAGFRWRQLVDPAKRNFLKLNHHGEGILVLSTVPGSGSQDVLYPNDVILAWDGQAIDNLGFYHDEVFGRMTLSFLIREKRRVGDRVPATVWRNGREMKLSVELNNLADDANLIPENVTSEPSQYLVEGGLIIRELDGRYLQERGGDWLSSTDSRLINLYQTRRDAPEKPGDRVVVLSGVLPHDVNVGYQRFRDAVITHVNGEPIRNMSDVFRLVDRDGHVNRLRLQSVGVDLVLDSGKLPAANAQLASQYRIPRLRYQKSQAEDRSEAQ